MKRYSSYKDSGVEWIGEIPSGWKHPKLRFYTIKIGSGSTPRGGSEIYVEEGIPFIRSQNVHFSGLELSGVSFITNEIHLTMNGTTVRKNDVLLNITGGSIGRCCLVDLDIEMNVNQHVSIIRTKDTLSPKFLNYLLYSDLGQKQVEYNVSGGNREGLTVDGISNFFITLPPLSEQQQIVSYLDEQTSSIDTLIQSKQKKITLLKEKRTSLINQIVTKGLNPNVEMKDSGVEWIGEIPSHWKFQKVKKEFSFKSGGTPSTENPNFWNGSIPWVSSKDMKSKYLEKTEDYITDEGLRNSSCSIIETNSLIMVVRSGILRRTIPVSINRVEVVVNQDQKVLSPISSTNVEFFYYFVIGNETNLLLDWMKEGTTVESIGSHSHPSPNKWKSLSIWTEKPNS
jgi:type I restriction enzyme, S subunit